MDYSPSIDRPIIKWPNNARVAFWVAPNIEHYEYMPLMDGTRNPWPRTPHPDVQQYSSPEFGNRVGFWRLLEVLDRYDIKCSTPLSIGVLEHFPEIAEAMLKRDWIGSSCKIAARTSNGSPADRSKATPVLRPPTR